MKTRIESKEEHLKAPCHYELLDVLGFKEEIIEADDDMEEYRYKYIELFPESETCDLTLISEKGSGYVRLMPYDDVVYVFGGHGKAGSSSKTTSGTFATYTWKGESKWLKLTHWEKYVPFQ